MIFSRIQKIYRIYPSVLFAITFLVISTNGCARSRLGEAEVRQVDEDPCFTITAKEAQRAGGTLRISALSVYDASVTPTTEIWSFTSKLAKMPTLSSAACIRYGQVPSGTDGTKSEPLKVGKLYGVILSTERVDSSDPTFGYDAKFCLVEKHDGGVRVQQVIYNQGWRSEVCY
jgi:hypothetical protein